MKRTIFIVSLLICIYSINIYADEISNELTNFALALQDLESKISEQPVSEETQPLTPLVPAPNEIQKYLDELEFIQDMLGDFKTAQQLSSIPLSQADLDIWKTELQELNNNVKFFKQNAPDNEEAKTKLIAIKDSIVAFLVYLKNLAQTKDQATTLLQYIDEFYTNGIAQADYQALLGDMTQSNATIEQLKNDLNAIINPVTPPVTAPVETQPLIPLVPAPAPTQPLIPATPIVPEAFKPYIPKLMKNIAIDQPKLQSLFEEGDTDKINDFMTKKAAHLPYYIQTFSDYKAKIDIYYEYLTDEQKDAVAEFLEIIYDGLQGDSMKTLNNLEKAQNDINALINSYRMN